MSTPWDFRKTRPTRMFSVNGMYFTLRLGRINDNTMNNKAKCEANQQALDRLMARRVKHGNSKFAFTIKRAIESVQKEKEPILTNQQALALKYVGPQMANIICPPTPPKRVQISNRDTVIKSKDENVKKRRSPPPPPPASCQMPIDSTPASAKEVAYCSARERSLDWKKLDYPLRWRVVLVIDGREQKKDHIQAKCQMSGIPTEERHLPIGDMTWIAQGFADASSCTTKISSLHMNKRQDHRDKRPKVELVLGTIIERKSVEDLKASLFGTRYLEQRLRLQHSGNSQIILLVEGDVKDLYNCSADTLHSAMWETRVNLGFSIIQTKHMEDTVVTLKRMHRRILQRTFPHAFRDESLPLFSEADASGVARKASSNVTQSAKRRRRRIQSLVEMTFDTDPVPPIGMQRFVTYQELKAKVEWDREAGTRTVGSIHLAMLKQVPTFSSKKCQAVASVFPTTNQLMQGYSKAVGDRSKLAEEISTSDPNASARETKVGPRSSKELYVSYGFSSTEEDNICSDEASKAYHRLVRDTQEEQIQCSSSKENRFCSTIGLQNNSSGEKYGLDEALDTAFWEKGQSPLSLSSTKEMTVTTIPLPQPDTLLDIADKAVGNDSDTRIRATVVKPAFPEVIEIDDD